MTKIKYLNRGVLSGSLFLFLSHSYNGLMFCRSFCSFKKPGLNWKHGYWKRDKIDKLLIMRCYSPVLGLVETFNKLNIFYFIKKTLRDPEYLNKKQND